MLKEEMKPIKLREQLLVEKCINSLILDYTRSLDDGYVNAEIDLKLDFLSFLTTNLPEEVTYGIEYLDKYPQEKKLLMPMILEYKTYGLAGQLECKPVPDRLQNQECSRNSKSLKSYKFADFIKNFINWFGGSDVK